MTSHLPITDSLLDSILSSALAIQEIDSYNCTLVCTADDPLLRTWMHSRPSDYTVKECYVSEVMNSYQPPDTIDNYIFIPISFLRCTYSQLIRIAKSNPNLIAIQSTTAGLLCSLRNPLLHTNPHTGSYVVVARAVDTTSSLESEWLSLWSGFNWNYTADDDPQVWLDSEELIKRNYRMGKEMGLTRSRMDVLLPTMKTI